jgi:hypothetical protein
MSDGQEELPLEEEFLGDTTSEEPAYLGVFEDVVIEDQPPDEPAPEIKEEPIQIGDGVCIVCGAPTFRPPGLTKAGHKKRAPKYCDLHSPNLRVQTPASGFTGMGDQLKRMQEELADDVRLLATMAGPMLPVTGMYVYGQADPFTEAIIKLAQKNQTALRILHRAAQVAPIYTVAQTLAGTAYAVQVDVKGADPHNIVGRRLGVADAYDVIHETTPSSNGAGFSGPPRYSTVQ